ncbi:MAG: glycosyltransferase [Gammaproteobacteria bacterium]|nr:glycosyltransferase [Gammaproteobacteria bacterium]
MSAVVVVGQTPPPFGGQAVMIEKMLQGDYGDVQLHHVRMAFSSDMDEIGKFAFGKILELLRVIGATLRSRFRHGATVLYYAPGGQNRLPIIRDIVFLLCVRWAFSRTVFHFHASGLADYHDRLPGLLRPLFRLAYFQPDAGIRLSPLAPEDATGVKARREYIVPNGIDDPLAQAAPPRASAGGTVHLLFVGVLSESKGVEVLIRAAGLLDSRGQDFVLELMGKFESAEYENKLRTLVAELDLGDRVRFLGVLTGSDKHEAFLRADIFTFPTFFESETFSVVLVEALAYGLPVVSTRWRAIPSIVPEGECGFLVPVHDSQAFADRVAHLIDDAELRQRFGAASRKRFLGQFTIDKYHQRLQQIFYDLAA